MKSIIDSLAAAGGQLQGAADWAAKNEQDRISAEGRLLLAEAKSERAALVLLDQYGSPGKPGALRRAGNDIARLLAGGDVVNASVQLHALLGRLPIGLHLAQPWRVVIAGEPNVGKSSLMNALVGYARSIVFDQPGTTRDVLTAAAVFDGWSVELADTAGLRETTDTIEIEGVKLARHQIAEADLVLLVVDAREPASQLEMHSLWVDPKVLVVRNKIDLCEIAPSQATAEVSVSALTGAGIEPLMVQMVKRFVPQPPERGLAVPFTLRQGDILQRTLIAVDGGEVDEARRLLLDL